jgi:hypothetical protein
MEVVLCVMTDIPLKPLVRETAVRVLALQKTAIAAYG